MRAIEFLDGAGIPTCTRWFSRVQVNFMLLPGTKHEPTIALAGTWCDRVRGYQNPREAFLT